MATPEQNALLAMQLMGAPFQQYNQQNDARTNLALRLAAMQREEQLKRELTDREAQLRRELAGFQADREDSRQLGMERRQKTQLDALQTREDTRATESERRQTAALDARDKQQITAEMNRLYPQYAQAAARAGEKIKQRNEYAETNEGLGQLAADARTAEVATEKKKLKGAAMALVGGLDEAVTAVDAIKSRIGELSKPLPQELKVARSQAVKALQAAIEQKTLASTENLRPAAIKKGLAHLAAGEDARARDLLGVEAFTAFENATEQVLLGLDSRKSAMQERSQLNQQLLQLQSQAARTNSDVMKAAAGNPFLADELATRRTAIQQLMTPIAEPRRQRSFGEVTPAPGDTGAAQPRTTGTTLPEIGASPKPATTATSNYKYPGLSLFGMAERMGANTPSGSEMAMAPANIAAFPGRVINEVGRYGGAGLQGLMTGDYSLPKTGIVDLAGEGIGRVLSGEFAGGPAPVVDVTAVLRERPGGPWSQAEQRAIQEFNATQPQGKNLLQTLFPGAR